MVKYSSSNPCEENLNKNKIKLLGKGKIRQEIEIADYRDIQIFGTSNNLYWKTDEIKEKKNNKSI